MIYVYDFKGYYIGGEAVIVADTEEEALALLAHNMTEAGLGHQVGSAHRVRVLEPDYKGVVMFTDGDY